MNEDNIEKAPNVPPFVRYVASTIPMVFDNSLSYYEALAALAKSLQDTVDVVNNNGTVTEEYIQLTKDMREYMDHYFDNLDVQAEINNKLDQMTIDGSLTRIIASYVDTYMDETINPIVDNQNERITEVEDKVEHLSSFAPIPVSSTSAMTNHDKTYVNTTDGKWYYWNGNAWAVGGTYQAVSLSDNSVSLRNLSNDLAKNVYHKVANVDSLGLIRTGNYNTTSPILIKAGTTIGFGDDFIANYKWALLGVNEQGNTYGAIIKADNTDASYTVANDGLYVLRWCPIDDNWSSETYTVNRQHYLTNTDITSITYYYPVIEDNYLVDLNINNLKQMLFSCTLDGSGWFSSNWGRFALSRPVKSSADIVLNIDATLDYILTYWDLSNGIDSKSVISATSWTNGVEATIPAGTYFSINMKLHDGGQTHAMSNIRDLIHLRSYSTLNDAKSFVDEYVSGVSTYNYNGENLGLQFKHGYDAETLFNFVPTSVSSQGFDIYNNQYLVQMFGGHGNAVQILDYTTGNEVGFIQNVVFGHADCCQFSNEFYAAGDLLPLLYTGGSEIASGDVQVIRIRDLYTASVIKTYELDSGCGYYTGESFDFENKIMYVMGYKLSNFRDGTNNSIIVSIYDMSKETWISGNKYSLALIDRYEIPFIYCIQGQKFFNGKSFMVSSYIPSEQKTYLYVYDHVSRRMIAKFDNMPLDIANYETEDLAFVKGSNKYDIIVGTREKYTKLSFSG